MNPENRSTAVVIAVIVIVFAFAALPAMAQQITGTPVDDRDYQVPFKLTAKLDKLTISIDRQKLTRKDVKKLREAEAKAGDQS